MVVSPAGELSWRGKKIKCALGRKGVYPEKKEGDGATPAGDFPVREIFYRPDRVDGLETSLRLSPIAEDDGWCDDPGDPQYNRRVKVPHPGSHEKLWRADNLYDIFIVLGHNDDPPEPGRGSAIFLHVTAENYPSTEGCVAVAFDDLVWLARELGPETMVRVLAVAQDFPAPG
ncbi:MAG: L,D-transpeptidase family protein [Nitrospinota bacterium]|nr:L,D-transpeptidase family protein [Nitrospinota bacterium]